MSLILVSGSMIIFIIKTCPLTPRALEDLCMVLEVLCKDLVVPCRVQEVLSIIRVHLVVLTLKIQDFKDPHLSMDPLQNLVGDPAVLDQDLVEILRNPEMPLQDLVGDLVGLDQDLAEIQNNPEIQNPEKATQPLYQTIMIPGV